MYRNLTCFVLLFNAIYSCNRAESKKENCAESISAFYKKLDDSKSLADTLKELKVFENLSNEEFCLKGLITKAEIYDLINIPNKAKEYCIKILNVDSLNIWALSEIGILYYDNKFYDSSVFYLRKALRLKTNSGYVIDIDNELNQYTKSPDVSSNEIIYFLALNYYYAGKFTEALNYLNYCIKYNFKIKDVYLYRGAIYYEEKQFDKGCSDFSFAKILGNEKADSYIEKYCSHR